MGKKYCYVLRAFLYDEEIEDFCTNCINTCNAEIEDEDEDEKQIKK
jgi:hypothetical protein